MRSHVFILSVMLLLPLILGGVLFFNNAEAVLTDDIEAYYNFNTGSADSTGTHDLTPHNSPTLNQTGGKISGCYEFDTSDYFSGAPVQHNGNETISFWVNSTSAATYQTIIKGDQGGTERCGVGIRTDGSPDSIAIYYRDAASDVISAKGHTTLMDGEWHFIMISLDFATDNVTMYVDNVSLSINYVVQENLDPFSVTTKYIGYDVAPQQNPFTGRLDELGFWDRNLTESERTELWNSGNGLTYPFGQSATNGTLWEPPTQTTINNSIVDFKYYAHSQTGSFNSTHLCLNVTGGYITTNNQTEWENGTHSDTKANNSKLTLSGGVCGDRGYIFNGSDCPTYPYASNNTVEPLEPQPLSGNPVIYREMMTGLNGPKFCADPFMYIGPEGWYIFVEGTDNDGKHICWCNSTDNGYTWVYGGIALEGETGVTGYSFPLMFKYNNSFYMIPMEQESNKACLYKATSFPTTWAKIHTLHTFTDLNDLSVFYFNNYWWLLAENTQYTLEAYYSTELEASNWAAHSGNPVANQNPTRPGGRAIVRDNYVLQPIQNEDGEEYGNSVDMYKITTLTTSAFTWNLEKRKAITESGIEGAWNKDRMHHMDSWYLGAGKGWLVAVDGYNNGAEHYWKTGLYCVSEGNALTGTYTSELFDAGEDVIWFGAKITATTPENTSYNIQYSDNETGWYDDISLMPDSRYLKYKITLQTTNSSIIPEISEVNITYISGFDSGSLFPVLKNSTGITNNANNTIQADLSKLNLPKSFTWDILLEDSGGQKVYAGEQDWTLSALGGMNHSGAICNETWTAAQNPHRIQDNCTVGKYCYLNVGPGCIINFTGNYELKVNGTLNLNGIAPAKIIINGYNRQSHNSILTTANGTLAAEHTVFKTLYRGAWIYAENTTIDHCDFSGCKNGIDTRADNTTIKNSYFNITTANDYGIFSGTIKINNLTAEHNTILLKENQTAGINAEGYNSTISYNTITGTTGKNNASYGVFCGQYNGTVIECNNLNYLDAGLLLQGWEIFLNNTVEIRLNTITHNGNGIEIYSSHNCTIRVHHNYFDFNDYAVYENDNCDNITLNCSMNWWGAPGEPSRGQQSIVVDTFETDGTAPNEEYLLNTKLIYPRADAYVDKHNPSINYGGADNLKIRQSTDDSINRIFYIKFNLSNIPGDSPIISAKVCLRCYASSGGGGAVFAYSLDEDWEEMGITWTNSPDLSNEIGSMPSPDIYRKPNIIDITNNISQAKTGDILNLGVAGLNKKISPGEPGDTPFGTFNSKDSWPANRPYLLITYGQQPNQINLNFGWNLIGVNLQNATFDNGKKITSYNLTNLSEISHITKRGNDGVYTTHYNYNPSYFELEYNRGYFVYCAKATGHTLELSGDPAGNTLAINQGWNLVGWSQDNTTANDIRSTYPQITHITTRTITGIYQTNYIFNPINFNVVQGGGYYFYSNSNNDLEF